MPHHPAHPCLISGCNNMATDGGRCERHRRQVQSATDVARGTPAERGYTHQWRKARAMYIMRHPLCVECLRQSPQRFTPATEIDHIIPHRGNDRLFWDQSNWQALCKRCHSAKTAKEDGGFGHQAETTMIDNRSVEVR